MIQIIPGWPRCCYLIDIQDGSEVLSPTCSQDDKLEYVNINGNAAPDQVFIYFYSGSTE